MEEKKEELKPMVLTIEVTPEGQINVNGPIQNEPLTFWMLEKAKDIIKGYNIKLNMQDKDRIINPMTPKGIMDFVRKRF